jgi:hypothetical protein
MAGQPGPPPVTGGRQDYPVIGEEQAVDVKG